MATEGNEPAYPSVYDKKQLTTTAIVNNGMSKREYMATQFMNGLLSSFGQHDVTNFDELASDSVKAADALIEALNTVKQQ